MKVEEAVWNWWKEHHTSMPNLSSLFRFVAVLQPTSAGAERVFSLFRKLDISDSAYEETLSLQATTYYNARKDAK